MTTFDWHDQSTGQIAIGEASLEYATWGLAPSKAPTIVMLHEGLGCVALWRNFPQMVAEATGCGVFAYSRSGYGQSSGAELPRPINYMEDEALNVLPLVLDAIGFQNGILLGHSDGATISAIYAGSVADYRIRGLILMAPHFFTEQTGLDEIATARTSYETTDLRPRMAKYHRDPDNAFYGWNDTWTNPEFTNWNVADVIDYLRIPVLAIQGRQDQYGTLAQIEEIENRIYSPVDVKILEDCQHTPHLEKTSETLASIIEFTNRLRKIENEQVKIA
ncbi:MAG: alpha/beta fold hydrolase [Pikeienuella sp.]